MEIFLFSNENVRGRGEMLEREREKAEARRETFEVE